MAVLDTFTTIGLISHFTGRCLRATLGAIRRPGAVALQLYDTLMGALPLAIIAGLALGAVIWMHARPVLARTGAAEFLPTVLAVAVLLELAPLGAGLILASRSGAHLGAEIGAMRISEQIDALELLGFDPMQRLVGPRILACVIALPLVHVIIATLAIGSGFIAEFIFNQTTWTGYQSAFLTGNRSELYLRDVIPAGLKTLVFGFVVGVAGCYHGLRAAGGTEGVGRAATSGVVSAALAVIAADVLLVGILQILPK